MTAPTPVLDRRTVPIVADAPGPLALRLAGIEPGTAPVVSCYVRLEPRDRVRRQYHRELTTRIQALAADPVVMALSREDRRVLDEDLSRIAAWLDQAKLLPHARGLAVFASERLDLFDAVALARVHRTRVVVDDTPWLAELVAAEHEFQPILVALVDRARARFFEVSASAVTELPSSIAAANPAGKFHGDRGDAPGWGEADYHRRLQEERHRHYAAVAHRLETMAQARVLRGIVLAGPADHTDALERFLPERLSARLLGLVPLNPTSATAAEVQAAALEAADAHERRTLAAELIALDGKLGGGWAVIGCRETLRALQRGQARTLYFAEGLELSGFRCAGSGRLVLSAEDCRVEGAAAPVRDVVDEAIEEALRQRIKVVMVPRGRSADVIQGLAATLRFR